MLNAICYIGKKKSLNSGKTNKKPKTWILTCVEYLGACGAAPGQPEVPVTSFETCFSVLQLARRRGWWPLSSVSLPHVQPHSRLSKYGFGSSSSSRAVCRSSKVLYWLNLPRPKSENNFKGSRSYFNFKKQLTIKKTKKPYRPKDALIIIHLCPH